VRERAAGGWKGGAVADKGRPREERWRRKSEAVVALRKLKRFSLSATRQSKVGAHGKLRESIPSEQHWRSLRQRIESHL
jgi:hypothetical protein